MTIRVVAQNRHLVNRLGGMGSECIATSSLGHSFHQFLWKPDLTEVGSFRHPKRSGRDCRLRHEARCAGSMEVSVQLFLLRGGEIHPFLRICNASPQRRVSLRPTDARVMRQVRRSMDPNSNMNRHCAPPALSTMRREACGRRSVHTKHLEQQLVIACHPSLPK